jgi:D-arabinose 1-dehydrogenase-like Zn-dependent alcohol dehydrogenase
VARFDTYMWLTVSEHLEIAMPKMRAAVVPAAHSGFRMEERDLPEPGRHEVRIRVRACGVCHSDVVTAGWAVGDRVGVGWFGGSCGYCRRCRRDEAFACENIHGATGVTRDGGYATHMLALASALAKVPAALDPVQSAPLLCAGITTFNALRHCGAGPGDLVAIHGVGGLGHLGIQFAARQGFHTVAVNRGRDKENLARSLGAHDYIDSAATDPAQALQATGGAKAIIATVTNAQAMQAIVGGLGPNGTMMVIGAVGNLTVDSLDMLNKRAAVRGWYSGTAPDSEDTLEFSQLNAITSMNEIFPLAQAQAAYDHMMSGKARFRVVLQMD